ncbi:MAG TPA: DUF2934 domain-containing protein [Steroidobacteraceae bacterium]|jgi:hypothetical protein|nr:DUF2934 domain-containing protein [Steroidobacteraceae bacterium]
MKPRKKTPHIFTPLPPPDAGAGQPEIQPRIAGIDPERRRAMVAEAAYYRAEQRGFEPGRELEDWCAAEAAIDSSLPAETAPTPCGP